MIPGIAELGVMLLNTGIGALITLKKNGQDIAERQAKVQQDLLAAQAGVFKEVRDYQGPAKSTGHHLTRRLIAIMVFATWAFFKIAPAFNPDLGVAMAYSEISTTNWFGGEHDLTSWATSQGQIVWGPVDNMLMFSVVGLFFGNQIAKR